jgi:hypothetical protein
VTSVNGVNTQKKSPGHFWEDYGTGIPGGVPVGRNIKKTRTRMKGIKDKLFFDLFLGTCF